ncbi:MAG: DUF4296 domain-containing protein [Bacteroidetes bacterium]|nr:DUF4296 domain-containing protein [Bacteroidota bacterium]
MNRLPIFLSVLSLSLLACSGKSNVPSGILPAEKMEAVLWDLLRAEQFVSTYVVGRDSSLAAKAKGPQLYAAILKKHGLTDSLFQVNLEYYKKHPQQLQPILDSIGQQAPPAPTPMTTLPPTTPVDSQPKSQPTISPTPPAPEPTPSNKRPNFSPKPMEY